MRKFNQYMSMIAAFKNVFGHVNINCKFVIPASDMWPKIYHNERLGLRVSALRAKLKKGLLSEEIKEKLFEIGFIEDATRKFRPNFDMLEIFKKEYGHLKIPLKYKVPCTENWPVEFHNKSLGSHRQDILHYFKEGNKITPEDKQRLDDMGFIENAYVDKAANVLVAFAEYKQKYNQFNVGEQYKVPKSPQYSESTHGLKLGKIRQSILSGNRYRSIVKPLQLLGMNLNKKHNFEHTYDAVVCFQKANNHVNIPIRYIVPEGSDFPQHLWGLQLGSRLHNMRQQSGWLQHRQRLAALGVRLKSQEIVKVKYQALHKALHTYLLIYGNLDVPESYTIPCWAPYDEEVWGLALGSRVKHIKYRDAYPEHRAELSALFDDHIGGDAADEKRERKKRVGKRKKLIMLRYFGVKRSAVIGGNIDIF